MKKIISLILALALCLSMVSFASAEGGTIMWLSNLSSGIQYETTRDYLTAICEKMGFDSLGYQTLDGLLEAIGLDRDKVCTYCWTGEE